VYVLSYIQHQYQHKNSKQRSLRYHVRCVIADVQVVPLLVTSCVHSKLTPYYSSLLPIQYLESSRRARKTTQLARPLKFRGTLATSNYMPGRTKKYGEKRRISFLCSRPRGFKDMETRTCDAVVLRIGNLEHWTKLTWSFLGAPLGPAGGWVEEDEERVDEAVGIVYEELVRNGKVVSDGAGGAEVRMVAAVVIAKK
jgi:hypothetical protein